MVLDDQDKLLVCGGRIAVAGIGGGWNGDEAKDSKDCEMYDFNQSEWIKLHDAPHSLSWNGSLVRCMALNDAIVGVYGNKSMSYNFHKNQWNIWPDTNNTYYYSFKLISNQITPHNILTVVGLERHKPVRNDGWRTGIRQDTYFINIEMFDYRDHVNKWIELKSFQVENVMLKAII